MACLFSHLALSKARVLRQTIRPLKNMSGDRHRIVLKEVKALGWISRKAMINTHLELGRVTLPNLGRIRCDLTSVDMEMNSS